MSIFISIASYEDPSLPKTMRLAIENAKYPDKIFFGLCLQYESIAEPDLSFVSSERVKIIRYHPKTRPGIYKVRSELSMLMTDQDYFLQIDSHTVFSKNWDQRLIKTLTDLSVYNDRVAISVARTTNKENSIQMPNMFIDLLGDDDEFGWLLRESKPTRISASKPVKINMFICNMIFADRRFVLDNLFNDSLHWANGEQTFLSFCAFISGWDIFAIPNNPVVHDDSEYNSVRHLLDKSPRWHGDTEYWPYLERKFVSDIIVNGFVNETKIVSRRSVEDFWSYMGSIDYFKYLNDKGNNEIKN